MQEPKIKPQLKLVAINYIGKCAGNAEKSLIAAGYSPKYARGNAYKVVARKEVQEYIQYLNENIDNARDIMDIQVIQEYWSNVIKDKKEKTKDRLRASELLAKSKGAFISEW